MTITKENTIICLLNQSTGVVKPVEVRAPAEGETIGEKTLFLHILRHAPCIGCLIHQLGEPVDIEVYVPTGYVGDCNSIKSI